ncbi:MAG: hypothetical protein CMJ19_10355 [Phycisphaeraceae bacterium]|nr:hypothetical protein [Phycisphaeraceae bacterium]
MLLIGILLPTLGAARRTARCTQNSTPVRGIHSALVLFSQDNNKYYPGINKDGNRMEDYSTEYRFQALLDDNYFTGEYIISPSETKTAMTQTGIKPTIDNYSYAFLNISDLNAKRMAEWKDTSNSEAVVLSDRAIAVDDEGHFKSVHVNLKDNAKTLWQGSVGFNDNHVRYLHTYEVDTQYGDHSTENDNLFNTTNGSMVYSGNDNIIDTSYLQQAQSSNLP